ncbi:MAG: hypothetical protein GX672_07925, partial [Synergistaceae bacterium]|nr:hypothetical protein [Synergistaceae bacterium]
MIRSESLESLLPKSLPFWKKINSNERDAIIDNISDIRYEKGTCLSGSDDTCAGVFLVRSGT